MRWFGIGMVRNVGIGGSERLCSLTENSREGIHARRKINLQVIQMHAVER